MLLVAGMASSGEARHRGKSHASPAPPHKRSDAEIENATRLQVFLDRANFSPSKIDGRYNDFTRKALALHRESLGAQSQAPPSHSEPHASVSPDVSGLDLGSVEPVFVPYTVTEADLQSVGRLPRHVA